MNDYPPGPYDVDPSWPKRQFKQALLLVLLGLPIGCFLGGYGLYKLVDAVRISGLADTGVEVHGVAYDGNVSSRYGVFNSYDLDVSFHTREGQRQEFEASFFSFGGGPDDGDPASVFYDPTDPSNAILSWEHEELIDGVVFWCVIGLGMGLFMALGLGWAALKQLLDVRLVKQLAKSGRIEEARVMSSEAKPSGKAMVVHLVLRFDDGVERKHHYTQGHNDAWLVDRGGIAHVPCLRGQEGTRPLEARGAPLMLS